MGSDGYGQGVSTCGVGRFSRQTTTIPLPEGTAGGVPCLRRISVKPNRRGIAALEVLDRSCVISRYSTSGRVNISVTMAAVALVAMPWPVAAGCNQYPMQQALRVGPTVGLAHADESAVFGDGVVVHVTACPLRL